ncbi:hypothetical protein EPA93_41455 [Ktedonosporobacter rubrisoli]|uniref:Thioredoxin n=2 Tax=Ktedonosporobacter rubrisoli TaxID=2509675 RepID=A0A4P6K276_KTERU|nr:thioredoxin domain-containing protein [Ktedonosporobacter rubrisoli]QBD82105.1 hypothetical protein EPA93_41455 [Ktedonosporobacter rubrisoli]
MADSYIEVTGADFAEKILNAPQMVIVNFATAQSSACQILEPEFAAISKEYQGRILFARLEVENQQELIEQWQIDGIPTLLFFKNGKVIHRNKGIIMRDKLRRLIEGVLLVS